MAVFLMAASFSGSLFLKSDGFAQGQHELNSPFGIHGPKVPDRPVPEGIQKLPPGFDLPKDVYAMGARWVRYCGYEGLVWDLVERQRGTYDWTRYDYMFSEAYNAGLNLLVVVHAGNRWDRPELERGRMGLKEMMPRDMPSYLNFLKAAVERYDGDGVDDAPGAPTVNQWEIQNEVDIDFWSDTPENYAKLLKESYAVIKKANPNATVLMAGMSHPQDWQRSYNFYFSIFKELDRLKDKPGDKYFDIINFHLYNFGNDFLTIMNGHLKRIKEELAQYGYSESTPFWLTETADYSDKPTGMGLKIRRRPFKSESEQAESLFKIYLYSLAHGVKKIFWVTLTEWHSFAGAKNGLWDNVGLINNPKNDGRPHKKLAYYTYKKMAGVLEGSDWNDIQVVREQERVAIYRFNKNGKQIWAAWNDNPEEKKITLQNIDSDQVRVVDVIPQREDGGGFREETVRVQKGTASFMLGAIPVLITGE